MSKMVETSRVTFKINLGWKVVYKFKVWIMPNNAQVDLIHGKYFMISAGVRLDLFYSTANLTGKLVELLLKSAK